MPNITKIVGGGVQLDSLDTVQKQVGNDANKASLNWTADKDYDCVLFVLTNNGVHYGSITNIQLNKNGSAVSSDAYVGVFNRGTGASGAGMQTSVYMLPVKSGDKFTATDTVYWNWNGCFGVYSIESN